MAFPTVQTADTKNGTVTSNSTSWTLTYPTSLASGDLILALVASDGNQASPTPPSWPADWSQVETVDSSSAVSLCVGSKIATGSETGNFTLTMQASEQGAWRIFRITGWYGTGNVGTADTDGVARAITTDTGASNPDPPSLNPANWNVEDTLWIAVCAVDTSRTISVYPLADLNTADVSGGAGGATLGVCMMNDAVASKDPGTFTISTADDWGALTVAVRPAAAGGTTYTKSGYGKESG